MKTQYRVLAGYQNEDDVSNRKPFDTLEQAEREASLIRVSITGHGTSPLWKEDQPFGNRRWQTDTGYWVIIKEERV